MPASSTISMASPLASCSICDGSGVYRGPKKRGKCHLASNQFDLDICLHLDDCRETYSTGDVLRGEVVVQSPVDLILEDVRIDLVGTSRTLIERQSPTPVCLPYTSASHDFLRISQPGLETEIPPDNALIAGERHGFRFTFVIPKHLPEGNCKHTFRDQGVKDEHLHLPPSLGRFSSSGKDNVFDDLAHEKGSVSYKIVAAITSSDEWSRRKHLTMQSREIRMIPAVTRWTEAEVHRLMTSQDSRYCTRKEEVVESGWLSGRRRVGTLVAEAMTPDSIRSADLTCLGSTATPTVLVMKLFFQSAESTNHAPPNLGRVTAKLKARTYITSSPYDDIPRDSDILFDASKSKRNHSFTLVHSALEGPRWRVTTDMNTLLPSYTPRETCAARLKSPHGSQPTSLETCISIPLSLSGTGSTIFVPSFHTCYISRMYTVEVEISYTILGTRRSLSLCLPLQITAGPSEQNSVFSMPDRDQISSMLPTYEMATAGVIR